MIRRVVLAAVAALALTAGVALATHDGASGQAGDARVEALFEQTTRSTQWDLVERVRLGFDAHHPEGVVKVGDRFFLSTVEVTEPTVRCPTTCDGTDRSPGKGLGWVIESTPRATSCVRSAWTMARRSTTRAASTGTAAGCGRRWPSTGPTSRRSSTA